MPPSPNRNGAHCGSGHQAGGRDVEEPPGQIVGLQKDLDTLPKCRVVGTCLFDKRQALLGIGLFQRIKKYRAFRHGDDP
jgi:hypothetical protein